MIPEVVVHPLRATHERVLRFHGLIAGRLSRQTGCLLCQRGHFAAEEGERRTVDAADMARVLVGTSTVGGNKETVAAICLRISRCVCIPTFGWGEMLSRVAADARQRYSTRGNLISPHSWVHGAPALLF